MKRQKLKLKVVDHRGDETTERLEVFDDDRGFSRRWAGRPTRRTPTSASKRQR
jgi:hypothetical protein